MSTPSERVHEEMAAGLEARRASLLRERDELLKAAERIAEIDAGLLEIDEQLTVIQPKRPAKVAKVELPFHAAGEIK